MKFKVSTITSQLGQRPQVDHYEPRISTVPDHAAVLHQHGSYSVEVELDLSHTCHFPKGIEWDPELQTRVAVPKLNMLCVSIYSEKNAYIWTT